MSYTEFLNIPYFTLKDLCEYYIEYYTQREKEHQEFLRKNGK